MLLTRRTFVQSSLAASLAAAIQATRATWLLQPNDPVRIAVAGLGPNASEHLALYAAIPGVQVVGLVDRSPSRFGEALAQLKKLNQPGPRAYTSLDSLLSHPALHAVSAPLAESSMDFPLHEVLATGLPVLTDVPPAFFSYHDFLSLKKAPVAVRVSDYIYPGARSDIHARWNLPPGSSIDGNTGYGAKLVLERRLTRAQVRAVLISALQAVLDSHSSNPAQLASWSKAADAIELTRASTSVLIHLPPQIAHFEKIEFDLLPRSTGASLLSLRHRTQTMEVPIWRTPDSQSSLRTVMNFLGEVRAPFSASGKVDTTNEAALSFAAASVVDRVLHLLRPTG